MNVMISGDAELFVREEVASGRYDSPHEVIQEGLRLLHEREILDRQRRERLDVQIEAGLDRRPPGQPPVAIDIVFKEKNQARPDGLRAAFMCPQPRHACPLSRIAGRSPRFAFPLPRHA